MNKWKAHLTAALYFGQESSCGSKIRHKTFSAASVAAQSASIKYGKPKAPYPCPFCDKWHVGRQMSQDELKKFA